MSGTARGAWARASDDLTAARHELEAKYTAELESLAAWCDERKLADEAAETRAQWHELDPRKVYLSVLRSKIEDTAEGEALRHSAEWRARFTKLRHAQASARFDLAQKAIRQGRPSLAFELVLSALHDNPDHEPSRRLLGYQRFRGAWHTPFEIRKLRAGQVWHEKFGWLPASYVERYEQGQRFTGGRWMSAADEARARSQIADGWRIETEHYDITTNHSLEAGVALGVELERLHLVWRQLFASYNANAGQLASLFEGRATQRSSGPRHRVVFFRDSDDYRAALSSILPPDVETTGFYWGDRRTAFFYATEDDDRGTLYHEATHQLFSETRPTSRDVGSRANFWLIEGIACYMESLAREEGYDTVGGADAVRYGDARFRLLESKFYVPLAQLSGAGMRDFQQDPNLPLLYSQAAGLSHFLMHYDEGRYRDALVALLSLLYAGQDRPGSLPELTGKSYSELDQQYREFMSAAP
ncbi:MAG: hypothetical protein KF708_17185 [Pirellulales bacterium]|nr:hypothetical protein [Pirellulales bacterium]